MSQVRRVGRAMTPPPGPPGPPTCPDCGGVFSIVRQRCVNGHGRPAVPRSAIWDCIRCGLLWDDENVPNFCPNCGDRPDLVRASYGIAKPLAEESTEVER